MASAGISALLFLRQQSKLAGVRIEVYVIAPQQMVLATMQNARVDKDFIIRDRYPDAE